jgi:hypothetical protein
LVAVERLSRFSSTNSLLNGAVSPFIVNRLNRLCAGDGTV